jgi:hypothetical protein
VGVLSPSCVGDGGEASSLGVREKRRILDLHAQSKGSKENAEETTIEVTNKTQQKKISFTSIMPSKLDARK